MKKIAIILSIATVAVASCNEIEDPVFPQANPYNEVLYGPAPEFSGISNPTKNVLIEEFTGHLCGFCPPATAMVNDLDEQMGARLVPISIHAGTLAQVSSEPFQADYNTEVGNVFWSQLEGGFNPAGRIDRIGGNSNFYLDNQWSALIASQAALSPEAGIKIEAEYIAADNNLNVHVHSQFINAMGGSYNIIVLLSESHIISAQEDYDLTPSEVLDYEHNHLLRTGITSALGEPLATNPSAGTSNVSSYTLPIQSNWVLENCEIVAFIINNTTGEVINAAELKL